jgi:hypothetical protein
MRPMMKRIVAALLGAVTIATPATALAEEGKWCSTYAQVESNATGGSYVGGILVYEVMATVTRTTPTVTTTTTTTSNVGAGIPGGPSAGTAQTITITTSQPGEAISVEEPVGYYAMNDGSVYQINCLTGDAFKVGD